MFDMLSIFRFDWKSKSLLNFFQHSPTSEKPRIYFFILHHQNQVWIIIRKRRICYTITLLLFIHSFISSFLPSIIAVWPHSLIHSFIHSFTHSFIHSLIHTSIPMWILHSHSNVNSSFFVLLHVHIVIHCFKGWSTMLGTFSPETEITCMPLYHSAFQFIQCYNVNGKYYINKMFVFFFFFFFFSSLSFSLYPPLSFLIFSCLFPLAFRVGGSLGIDSIPSELANLPMLTYLYSLKFFFFLKFHSHPKSDLQSNSLKAFPEFSISNIVEEMFFLLYYVRMHEASDYLENKYCFQPVFFSKMRNTYPTIRITKKTAKK